jgi:hypothetical protein
MTDALFDAARYGPGREKRKRDETPPRTIKAGQDWGILTRRNKPPDAVVHRWRPEKVMWTLPGGEKRWEGAYKTMCGITGHRLLVEPGTEIVPCPKCEKL